MQIKDGMKGLQMAIQVTLTLQNPRTNTLKSDSNDVKNDSQSSAILRNPHSAMFTNGHLKGRRFTKPQKTESQLK